MESGRGAQASRRPHEEPAIENRVIGIREMSELLGVSRTTAWRMIRSGKVQAIRVGNNWKTTLASCEDYLRRQRLKSDLELNSR